MRLPLSAASLVAFLCLHQPAFALSPPAHVAAVAEPSALQPQAFQSVVTHSASTSPHGPSDIEWLLILSVVLTGGVISWGIRQYAKQQTWQRIEFLRQAVKEFEHAPEVHNALKILDFEEYRDYQIPAGSEGKTVSFRVDDELLCNALATHDQRARQKQQLNDSEDRDQLDPEALRQYQIETALRDWFNAMLNGLEHFGYFIESGMFSEKELRPWLNYWIKLIAEPAYRRPGASRFYDALYSYIHNSGFFGVQKLFDRFGYRILPSPYQDTDLANIALSTSSYDSRLALTLAKASYLAYQDKQFVAQIVGRWGAAFEADRDRHHPRDEPLTQQAITPRVRRTKNNFIRHNFRYFNNRGRDTQAYMFRTDEFVVLAFRGSQEPQDWLTNFTTQLRNFTIRKDGVTGISSYKGRVHTGFFLAWAIIEKSVLSQIHRWRHEMAEDGKRFPPLYITGHSLGGALATMAAAALIDNGISVAGVYTFGQPRVGDRTFVKQLNLNTGGKVFRFVNNNDIVPHVPPPFSIWNPMRLYTHVGTAKYFNAKGIMMANYKLTSRLFDGGFGLVRGIFGAGFDLITDHNMEYYISHLNDALQEELEDKAAQMLEVGKQ
ncbi:MAG: lipase family protein [Cyanobacteria bacterium J06634_5]